MLKKIADLKGRLTSTEQQLASAQAQVAQLQDATGSTATSSDTASVQQMAASERQISQVLIVAQQSADKIVADARQSADDIRNEADQKAREVIRQALAEKQTELDEIERLKDSQDSFREAYKKMLQHFMDDADAVLPGKKGEQVDVSVLENKANGSFAASASQDGAHAAASDAALSDFSDLD